mmetsp:Transcript_14738/g.31473  ORF Transcript_14738/g.31473 Transcript_14738/m.31473 type:complete len:283 (+) Transcript_14738:43-891(+)
MSDQANEILCLQLSWLQQGRKQSMIKYPNRNTACKPAILPSNLYRVTGFKGIRTFRSCFHRIFRFFICVHYYGSYGISDTGGNCYNRFFHRDRCWCFGMYLLYGRSSRNGGSSYCFYGFLRFWFFLLLPIFAVAGYFPRCRLRISTRPGGSRRAPLESQIIQTLESLRCHARFFPFLAQVCLLQTLISNPIGQLPILVIPLRYSTVAKFLIELLEFCKHFFPLSLLRVPFKPDGIQSRNSLFRNLCTSLLLENPILHSLVMDPPTQTWIIGITLRDQCVFAS